jgi:hypothetical protein
VKYYKIWTLFGFFHGQVLKANKSQQVTKIFFLKFKEYICQSIGN